MDLLQMRDKGSRKCQNVAFLVVLVLTLVVKTNSSYTYSFNKHQALQIVKYYDFCLGNIFI